MAGRTDHARTTLSMIEEFYQKEEYWDVQLQVDGRLFKCQRVLLAVTSMYFDDLFKIKNVAESNPTPNEPIILNDLKDATAFEEILHFTYTGDIRVNDSNALHLLSLSKFLRLRTDDVEEACLQLLTNHFRETIINENAIDLFCSARSNEDTVLVNSLSTYIFEHLYDFLMNTRLMEISLENLKALLVCGEDIIVPLPGSSDVLLAFILKWVNCNREERRQYRCELMDSIDSSKVSSNFLVSYITRLEIGLDKAKLSKDVESISESKGLEMGIDIGDIGSNARLSATISFNVKNISKLECGQRKFSPSCIISNLSWMLCIEREKDDVNLCVVCDGAGSTLEWRCYARAIFTIKSLKKELGDFSGESDCVELSSVKLEYSLDCRTKLKFDDLINPEKGFIKDDDSLIFDSLVYAGVPCRIE